jgi:hypothetical protein
MKTLSQMVELRQNKYLNNVVEQDHRNIKRIVKPMMGFKSFNTARRTLRGIETMSMIRKRQVNGINQGDQGERTLSIKGLVLNKPHFFSLSFFIENRYLIILPSVYGGNNQINGKAYSCA